MRRASPFRPPSVGAALWGAHLLMALAWAGGTAPAAAQQPAPPPNRQVTVQNETDQELHFLYLFPPGSADRGPDRLGDEAVAPGTSHRARLGRQTACVFDLVAIWQDGREETRSGVNICRVPRLVFGDPAMPVLEATVTNASDVPLRELYASQDGAAGWGHDRLGSQVVEPRDSFRLRMRTRDCTFDLRAVYADDRAEERNRLDLCAQREVSLDRSAIPRLPMRELVLLNRHLAAVQEVYVSASSDSDWGPDRLDHAAPLPVGQDATLALESDCQADIRIVFPNGGAEERREIDICETPRIHLVPGWVLGVAQLALPGSIPLPDFPEEPAANFLALKIRNEGSLPIVELYASPPGMPRGADRLGAEILGVGEAMDLEPTRPDACDADLVIVFRDGREVARPGIDLCRNQELVVR